MALFNTAVCHVVLSCWCATDVPCRLLAAVLLSHRRDTTAATCSRAFPPLSVMPFCFDRGGEAVLPIPCFTEELRSGGGAACSSTARASAHCVLRKRFAGELSTGKVLVPVRNKCMRYLYCCHHRPPTVTSYPRGNSLCSTLLASRVDSAAATQMFYAGSAVATQLFL